MSEAAKWYVIHTYSGYENKVKQNIEKVVENRKLHDLILEVRVPTEKVTEITDGKTKEVERKTFPGYVLLKMVYTDESWYIVKSTRGVTGFVGPASEPTPLSEKEVEALVFHLIHQRFRSTFLPETAFVYQVLQWTDSLVWYRRSMLTMVLLTFSFQCSAVKLRLH